MRLMAWPSRPSSSPRRSSTRASNRPSEICSVARVICDSERVTPRTSGIQNSTEKISAPNPTTTHGVGSKNKPPALSESDTSSSVTGQGRLAPGSVSGRHTPTQ